MKQFLELSDIPRILDQRIKECGGIEQFETKHNLFVNPNLLCGDHYPFHPGLGLLRALGLKEVTVYERIEG